MSFGGELQKFKAAAVEKAGLTARIAGERLFQEVMDLSPVKTGLYKANNRLGVNTEPQGRVKTPDPDGAATTALAMNALGACEPGDRIIIANTSGYARPVEFGTHGPGHAVYSRAMDNVAANMDEITREVLK